VTITSQRLIRGGASRIGTRSGLDAGGAAPHNARLPVPDATTHATTPCRAPAARRARGAKRQRAHSRTKRRRVRAVSARLEDVAMRHCEAVSVPSGPASALLVVRCSSSTAVVARRQASAASLALAQLGRGEIGTGKDAGAGSAREFVEVRGQWGLGYDECDHLSQDRPRTSRNGLPRHKVYGDTIKRKTRQALSPIT
jgi:hypothetical protein